MDENTFKTQGCSLAEGVKKKLSVYLGSEYSLHHLKSKTKFLPCLLLFKGLVERLPAAELGSL